MVLNRTWMQRSACVLGLLVFIGGCAVDFSNPPFEDQDGDGVTPALGDCDDTNPAVSSADGDSDCDGVPTEDDCDDYDPVSYTRAEDGDCDGVTPALGDCDDLNAAVSSPNGDSDCDGVPTDDDCDDYSFESSTRAEDVDCDGVLTDDDCDDGDAGSTAVVDDADCDGVVTADDCDDGDETVGNTGISVVDDADCDGVVTADDCDDGDESVGNTGTSVVDDADCDGVLTADDCDDRDGGIGVAGSVMTDSDIDFVCVLGRTFDMGCTPGQSSCDSDESPVRTTTLTRRYYMSRTEVTQGQFAAVMDYNPSYFTSCGSSCPVEDLTWHEAANFANAVSTAAGLAACYTCSGSGASVTCSASSSAYSCAGYRLPTEAEWEGAARCGEDLLYAGSNTINAVAWYFVNSGGRTRPVAGLAPNACALYDISGNVWEWTNDWYSTSAYGGGAATDPTGFASGAYRVFRGGSWVDDPQYARVAKRSYAGPGLRSNGVGVRLVRTAP